MDQINYIRQQLFSYGKEFVPIDTQSGWLGQRALVNTSRAMQGGDRINTMETSFSHWLNSVTNPRQDIIRDPDIEETVFEHPMFWACFQKRAYNACVQDWNWYPTLSPGADEYVARGAAAEMQKVWDSIPENTRIIYICMLAVALGSYGIEFIWKPDEKGELKPRMFYPVHPDGLPFDRIGNMDMLTRSQPVWGGIFALNPQSVTEGPRMLNDTPLFPGKLVYHRHVIMSGPWTPGDRMQWMYYGRGEIMALWKYIKMDNFVTQYRAKFLERHGLPPLAIYYPQNTPNPSVLNSIIASWRGETTLRIPKRDMGDLDSLYGIKVLETKTTTDPFASFSRELVHPMIEAVMNLSSGVMMRAGRGGLAEAIEGENSGPQLAAAFDMKNISQTFQSQFAPWVLWRTKRFAKLPLDHMPQFGMMKGQARNRLNELSIMEKLSQAVPTSPLEWYKRAGVQPPRSMSTEQLEAPIPPGEAQLKRMGGRPAAQPWVKPERQNEAEQSMVRERVERSLPDEKELNEVKAFSSNAASWAAANGVNFIGCDRRQIPTEHRKVLADMGL